MAFPELPWKLKGEDVLLVASYLVPVKEVEAIVPKPLNVISVLPNRTIGAIIFNKFGKGSEIEYNEIYCAPAFVGYKRKMGFYTEQMFVDNEIAMTGVYEASGIRKELADFEWDKYKKKITVSQKGKIICEINYKYFDISLPKAIFTPRGMGIIPGFVLNYKAVFRGRLGLAKCTVNVSENSNMKLFMEKNPIISIYLNKWDAELFYPIKKMNVN